MMKRRIFAALLSAAMVLSLAACGGKTGGGSAASDPGASSSQPDGSQPDASQPGEVTLTLNKTEITLNKAGGTFQLKYTAEPAVNATAAFTSSDEKVATVSEDGTITAVAPGKATVTVELAGAAATAAVTCDWKEESPDTSKPAGDASKPEIAPPDTALQVNLSDFYTTTTGKYQFTAMMEANDDMLSNFFAGLSDLTLAQQVVYLCGMSPSPNGDFALIQVSDSKDADTVKAILQARIDYMVGDGNGPGGAFYPMEQTMWEENARIVTNGNYIMMVVHENCDDIVKEFNALF